MIKKKKRMNKVMKMRQTLMVSVRKQVIKKLEFNVMPLVPKVNITQKYNGCPYQELLLPDVG